MDLTNPFGDVIKESLCIIQASEEEINTVKHIDEKFKIAFNQTTPEQIQNTLGQLLFRNQQSIQKDKDAAKSIKIREEGNKFFREGKFSECLRCYNNSILLAPCHNNFDELNDSAEFAMCLTNRAAILGKFKMHKNASEDLEVAIKSGYPKHLLYKAYQRLGVAYEGLGDQDKARSAYENLLTAFDFSDIPNDKLKKMKNDARFALESLDTISSSKQPSINQLTLSSVHEDIKTFSSNIKIRKTETKGRFAVAGEKIGVGEVVSRETALVSSLIPSKRRTHCLHCCQETICPLPCDGCCSVVFCSQECRKEGMVVHRYECKISSFLSTLPTNISQLTTQFLITVSAVLRHPVGFHLKVFDNWKNGTEPEKDNKEAMAYYGLHNLVKHFDEIDILQLFATAITMLQFLRKLDYCGDDLKEEEELKLGQILCHYFAAVLPNIHAIFEMKPTPENPTKTCMVAVALFPNVASHFNHSCDPNTFVIDIGRTQVTVAARTILPGEEICHVYFGHFGDTSKDKRQSYLLQKYHFRCDCAACEHSYPNTEQCLEITKTFVGTPKENMVTPLSQLELENLDVQNAKLQQMTESALSKNMLPRALEVTKQRIELICEHLKQPHILHMMGRCSLVNYMSFLYGNRSFEYKPKRLPCYF